MKLGLVSVALISIRLFPIPLEINFNFSGEAIMAIKIFSMKITIITVVYNGEKFLADCIDSVASQDHNDIEYIVVDGNSTDSTSAIIAKKRNLISKLITEADDGLYDAINKGLKIATGDVVGLLNADDMLAASTIISNVVRAFQNDIGIDGIYGNLNYIHPQSGKTLRRWRSKQATIDDIANGWMPAHPTIYLKRKLIEHYGDYALNFGTAADYDFILRYFYTHKIKCIYLPLLMVKMRLGGVSNSSFQNRLLAFKYDYKALLSNGVPYPLYVVLAKKLVKFGQYFR